MTINYIIFSADELNKINFEEVLEDSVNTVRKSLDGTLTFVKWEGNIPPSVKNLQTKSNVYSVEQIKEIINTSEWNERL
jgi:hypothetical protein